MKENFNPKLVEIVLDSSTILVYSGKRECTTEEECNQIIKRKYWDSCRCDMLPVTLDTLVFKESARSSPTIAIKKLQEVLRLEPTGIMCPDTLKHIKLFPLDQIIKEYQQ